MTEVIEFKDPKTDRIVRFDPKFSIFRFLSTFRWWPVTALMLGHYLLGGLGIVCIIIAITIAATGTEATYMLLPVSLIYISLGSYFALNDSKLAARSYLRRGWVVVSGDIDSGSTYRPAIKAALLTTAIIVAIVIFAIFKVMALD